MIWGSWAVLYSCESLGPANRCDAVLRGPLGRSGLGRESGLGSIDWLVIRRLVQSPLVYGAWRRRLGIRERGQRQRPTGSQCATGGFWKRGGSVDRRSTDHCAEEGRRAATLHRPPAGIPRLVCCLAPRALELSPYNPSNFLRMRLFHPLTSKPDT